MTVPKCDDCGKELDRKKIHAMRGDITGAAITNQGHLRPRFDNVRIVCTDCTKQAKETEMATKAPPTDVLEGRAKHTLDQLTSRVYDEGFEAGVRAGFNNARSLYDPTFPGYTGTPEQEQVRDAAESNAAAISQDLSNIAKVLGLKLVERTSEDDLNKCEDCRQDIAHTDDCNKCDCEHGSDEDCGTCDEWDPESTKVRPEDLESTQHTGDRDEECEICGPDCAVA